MLVRKTVGKDNVETRSQVEHYVGVVDRHSYYKIELISRFLFGKGIDLNYEGF